VISERIVNTMKGLAMIEKGVVDWIEKDYPLCGDIDAIVRPIAISPCSSDVHNVEMGYISPMYSMG